VKVKGRMTPLRLAVGLSQTLEEAAEGMVEKKVGCAVVLDEAQLVGILTERDLMRAAARGIPFWNTKVTEVMTTNPQCVSPNTEDSEAKRIMLDGHFRHLPVVDCDRVVGMLSLRDFLEAEREASGD
jgi:CBS domain-containing protein